MYTSITLHNKYHLMSNTYNIKKCHTINCNIIFPLLITNRSKNALMHYIQGYKQIYFNVDLELKIYTSMSLVS